MIFIAIWWLGPSLPPYCRLDNNNNNNVCEREAHGQLYRFCHKFPRPCVGIRRRRRRRSSRLHPGPIDACTILVTVVLSTLFTLFICVFVRALHRVVSFLAFPTPPQPPLNYHQFQSQFNQFNNNSVVYHHHLLLLV